MRSLIVTSVILIGATAAEAEEGLVVSVERTHGNLTDVSRIYFAPTRLVAENPHRTLYFDADANILQVAIPETRTYEHSTSEEMHHTIRAMSHTFRSIQQTLSRMPADERKKVAAELGLDSQTMLALGTPTVRDLETTETIGGWTCQKFEVLEGDQVVMQVWTTDPASFGLTDPELDLLAAFGSFFGDLDSPVTHSLAQFLRDFRQKPPAGRPPGVPVRVEFGDEVRRLIDTVTSVSREDIPEEQLVIPPDYTRIGSGTAKPGHPMPETPETPEVTITPKS